MLLIIIPFPLKILHSPLLLAFRLSTLDFPSLLRVRLFVLHSPDGEECKQMDGVRVCGNRESTKTNKPFYSLQLECYDFYSFSHHNYQIEYDCLSIIKTWDV
jgi:hypothetical protein